MHVHPVVHVQAVMHPPVAHEPAESDEKPLVEPGRPEAQAADRWPSEQGERDGKAKGERLSNRERNVSTYYNRSRLINASTRLLISSRTIRTSGMGSPFGSRRGQSSRRRPGT